MKSVKTVDFDQLLAKLPAKVHKTALKQFQLWRESPLHPSLHFKCVSEREDIWSARVGRSYRALCVRDIDTYIWFWIGSHAEYDLLVKDYS